MVQELSGKRSLAGNVAPREVDFSFRELSIAIAPPTGLSELGRLAVRDIDSLGNQFEGRKLNQALPDAGSTPSAAPLKNGQGRNLSRSEQQMYECGYCTGCTTCTQCTGCTACTGCTLCTACTPTVRNETSRSSDSDELALSGLKSELAQLLVTKG